MQILDNNQQKTSADIKYNYITKVNDYKFVFLILNYETYWETIQCVESIFKTVGNEKRLILDYEIVIVDNGSKNESVNILRQKYDSISGIYIVESGTNLGFAKGNNIGFNYIKNNLNADFIVMINSDIVFTDTKLIEKIEAYYKKYAFNVGGPNVILNNGTKLNPVKSNLLSCKDVEKRLKQINRQIRMCKLGIEPLYAVYMRIVNKCKKRYCDFMKGGYLNLENGFQLHGCFLIFDKEYIHTFDGIYDKTFLYGEETLLRLRCQKMKYKMCYLEDVSAIHNESRTEKFLYKKINHRHLNRLNHTMDSLKIIHEYMELNKL